MEIRLIGSGGRMRECVGVLKARLENRPGRLLLLPIPTTRDKIFITSTNTTTSAVAEMIDSETVVAGYSIPKDIVSRAGEMGAPLFDASLDERFLLDNAKISGEGALGYILTHSTKALRDMRVGIVGYGRIGHEMTRLCLLFGAEVIVYTARESVTLELGEMGIDARLIDGELDLTDIDILINTTPKRQIDEGAIPKDIDIIDLASGSIFEPSERLIKLSSIPDAFYPETAGRLYAGAILRFLEGEGRV